jgi:predicted CopG family antitoxin
MTGKTIAISDEIHRDLRSLKIMERETFNDVIGRLIDAGKKE